MQQHSKSDYAYLKGSMCMGNIDDEKYSRELCYGLINRGRKTGNSHI